MVNRPSRPSPICPLSQNEKDILLQHQLSYCLKSYRKKMQNANLVEKSVHLKKELILVLTNVMNRFDLNLVKNRDNWQSDFLQYLDQRIDFIVKIATKEAIIIKNATKNRLHK